MPTSVGEGKDFARDYLRDKGLRHIVDVGPGAGAYRDLLADHQACWTAIEVWAPYVARFDLARRYDRVIIADARWLDWDRVGPVDLVIFGDVIEHMPSADAVDLLHRAAEGCRYMLVSLPIVHYPQGEFEGNPFEAHVAHWTDETVRDELLRGLTLIDSRQGTIVGMYIVKGAICR